MGEGAQPAAGASRQKRRVLIVGGGIAGLTAARELRKRFRVTLVDPKEYFEFTSGILRAYCAPSRWESLTFLYHEILERKLGVRFIWGEVTGIDSEKHCATVRPVYAEEEDVVPYDFCFIAGGCNFNSFSASGESPWFPTVHRRHRPSSDWKHIDERFFEGRRRRVLEEHHLLQHLNDKQASVLVVGAGFMGVEWACELQHFFPDLNLTVADFLPRCLGPLPDDSAGYCEKYMKSKGIKTYYGVKYDPNSQQFWSRVGLPGGASRIYATGVKGSNYFMPKNTLSQSGPGGGGWILINRNLQVVTTGRELWGHGAIFAAGDCTTGSVPEELPPIPKIGYAAEQQAIHACANIKVLDRRWHRAKCCCIPLPAPLCGGSLRPTWYPWGAGIFSISLGPQDGCVVLGHTEKKGSGRMWMTGLAAAALKETIQTSKMAHYQGDHRLSIFIWYVVHHWPLNLCGRGPCCNVC